MIWIVGEYADRIENSDELLDDFLFTFLEEPVEVRSRCFSQSLLLADSLPHSQVQLALLTATVKLFIKRPTAGQELVPKVLKWATEEVDNPDLRDRGFIYWRLLSTDPGAAFSIVFAPKPPISTESEAMDRGVLDRLLLHTGTLASLYGKEPQTFIRGARAKYLQDSPALDPAAKQSYLDSLNLPAHEPTPSVPDPSLAPPPAVPPKPFGERQDSMGEQYGRQDTREYGAGGGLLDDDEDEDAALNPSAQLQLHSPAMEQEDAMDPYASLARMSGEFGGGRSAGTEGSYYAQPLPVPRSARGMDESLL